MDINNLDELRREENEIVNKFKFTEKDFGKILTNLLKIPTVTNINCWYDNIIVTDNKKGEEYRFDFSNATPEDIEEYRLAIRKMPENLAHNMGKPYTHAQPILDAENTDNEDIGRLRINSIYSDVVTSDKTYQPAVSIRKTLMKLRINKDNILSSNYASQKILDLFEIILKARCSMVISGKTNAGKTELLRYEARNLEGNIITIEDTREAYLKYNYPEKNVLEIKADPEDFSKFIRACLRQAPDWILVSESRNEEVLDLLNSVSTGHSIVTTLHSSSAPQIPNRIVDMAKVSGSNVSRVTRQVYQNIDIGVHLDYQATKEGSKRKIEEICEYFVEYNNETGREINRCHTICKYNYETKRYEYFPIQSPRIKEQLLKRNISTENIKGVFIQWANIT